MLVVFVGKKSAQPDTKLKKSPTPVRESIEKRISPSVERESNVCIPV